MDQERVVEARLAKRTLRPGKEMIKDDVNRQLRIELDQIQQFSKQLRSNMDRIRYISIFLKVLIKYVELCDLTAWYYRRDIGRYLFLSYKK